MSPLGQIAATSQAPRAADYRPAPLGRVPTLAHGLATGSALIPWAPSGAGRTRREARFAELLEHRSGVDFSAEGPDRLWVASSTTRIWMAIFDLAEGWYNPHQRHSSLDYASPIEYERKNAA